MLRRALRVLALAAALAAAGRARADTIPLGACGPIARPFDPIELPAERIAAARGTPIARLGLVAFRHGRLAPIPFQIDERSGRKLALTEGPEPTHDERPGVLDWDDLVVFMACDAGEHAPPDALGALLASAHLASWHEIRIEDALDHTTGFAYLVVGDDPPATPGHYVEYDGAADLVRTTAYRVGMVKALPNYFALAPPGRGPGPNLLDGLRLRAEATLRADLAHWTLNEQQGNHELIAWKAGAVRVVRRSRHQVNVGFGIRLTAATAHSYFYPRMVFGPGSLKLPISPGLLLKEVTAFGGADFRDLRGWRYHATGVPPAGFAIDGRMDEAERKFAADGEWFAVEHDGEAVLMVTRMSENLRNGIRLGLIYRDDAEHGTPPEAVPGSLPLVGYQGFGVEKLPAGRYTFELRIYMLPGFTPGDEKPILAQLDAPLAADGGAHGP